MVTLPLQGHASTFQCFLSVTEQRPNYSTGECEDPLRWLQPETFYSLAGTVTSQDGNPIRGVIVTIRGGRVDGQVKTPRNTYRVYIPPGTTVTITPRKEGYVFEPASRTVTVDRAEVTAEFIAHRH